ncbi:hypothetical protein [Rubidibacter lacunae]|nr:hypothetical protein [Rubidibacter lacunae]
MSDWKPLESTRAHGARLLSDCGWQPEPPDAIAAVEAHRQA